MNEERSECLTERKRDSMWVKKKQQTRTDRQIKLFKQKQKTVSFIFMVNDHIEISIQFTLFNFHCDSRQY